MNGANRPDISVLDKKNKEWIIIEGTICNPGTITMRTKHKKDKYIDLKLGISETPRAPLARAQSTIVKKKW